MGFFLFILYTVIQKNYPKQGKAEDPGAVKLHLYLTETRSVQKLLIGCVFIKLKAVSMC